MSKKKFAISLFIGIAFDILFWKKIPGISFTIFVLLCLLGGHFILRGERTLFSKWNIFLLIPLLFFSTMVFIRLEPFTTFLNFLITLQLLVILTISYQSGNWLLYSLPDYIANLLRLFGGLLSFPLVNKMKSKRKNENSKRGSTISSIIRGLLLSVPIIIIFTIFLSEADPIFSDTINTFLAFLKLDEIPEFLFRGLLVFLIVNIFTGMTIYASSNSQSKKLVGVEKPVIPAFLGSIEAFIILGSVLILFTSFVSIQFQYFFFGKSNISITGFTYAEYARRGFGEMVIVSIFSLILILSLSTVAKRETKNQEKIFTGMVCGLVFLVLTILVSAFQRLYLYETAYGFSRLRTYAHVFMIWLGILLLATAILHILKKNRLFANIALSVIIGFTVTLNFLNVDAFIVKQNISRAVQGNKLDSYYLTTLSMDAVPSLAQNYTSKNLPHDIKQEIGDALYYYEGLEQNEFVQNWQSFHLSRWKADQILQQLNKNK